MSTKSKNQDQEVKEVPTADNNVFDHSAKSVGAATGVTGADIDRVKEGTTEIILAVVRGDKPQSELVEAFLNNATPKTLASMATASMLRKLEEEQKPNMQAILQALMSGE